MTLCLADLPPEIKTQVAERVATRNCKDKKDCDCESVNQLIKTSSDWLHAAAPVLWKSPRLHALSTSKEWKVFLDSVANVEGTT